MQERLKDLLGLTTNETKVYIALLSSPLADPLTISQDTKLARTRVYEVLSKLISKNLVDKTTDGYRVVHPQTAIELMQEKIHLHTQNRIDALTELIPHLTDVWREAAIDVVSPGIEIMSYVDIEAGYLKELENIQCRVYIAASDSTGGINWKKSGERLAKAYKKDLDIKYLYSDSKMAEKMIFAFKHFVPFSNLNIKIRSNAELKSSFILLDNKLYIFFMATDTFSTKVLSVNSSEMIQTFEWIFSRMWKEAIK